MVATTGLLVLFVAVKTGIFPVPEFARPILGREFVQLKFVAFPVRFTKVEISPLQIVWLVGIITVGVGITVISNDVLFPIQVTPPPVNWDVTVTIETIGSKPKLTALKLGIFPVPLNWSPVVVLLLTQVYEVPLPEKLIEFVGDPLQMVTFGIVFIIAVGLTEILKFKTGPTQVVPKVVRVWVTEIVEDTTELVLFKVVKIGIFPFPLWYNPIVGLLLTHENVEFKTLLPIWIGCVNVLLQKVISEIELTIGFGKTWIKNSIGLPIHWTLL